MAPCLASVCPITPLNISFLGETAGSCRHFWTRYISTPLRNVYLVLIHPTVAGDGASNNRQARVIETARPPRSEPKPGHGNAKLAIHGSDHHYREFNRSPSETSIPLTHTHTQPTTRYQRARGLGGNSRTGATRISCGSLMSWQAPSGCRSLARSATS